MRRVPLAGKKGVGMFALIDDEDLPLVAQSSWYLDSGGYASSARHVPGKKKGDAGRSKVIRLHRLIMGFPEGQVDHKDRDRLNCQRSNLRVATHTENTWNMTPQKKSKAGYLGVRQESPQCFIARLGNKVVGRYATALEAAQARDLAAIELRGEFAVLNFPIESLPQKVFTIEPRNVGERTSQVVGVSYAAKQRRKDKWRAVYRKVHLGWFHTEIEAIAAIKGIKNES